MIKVRLHEAVSWRVAAFWRPVDIMAWRVLTTLELRCLRGCGGIGAGGQGDSRLNAIYAGFINRLNTV